MDVLRFLEAKVAVDHSELSDPHGSHIKKGSGQNASIKAFWPPDDPPVAKKVDRSKASKLGSYTIFYDDFCTVFSKNH